MKRFLLTAMLMLAMVTSLTAGTMAAYNTTINVEASDVRAKKFNITTEKGSNFTDEGIKIAPGDSVWYKMTVANEGEISFDVKAVAEIEGELAQVCQVEMFKDETGKLFQADNSADNWSGAGGTVNTEITRNDVGAQKVGLEFVNIAPSSDNTDDRVTTVTFYLKVSWPYAGSSETDNQMAEKSAALTLNVDINATSHNVHKIYRENGASERDDMDLKRGTVRSISQ